MIRTGKKLATAFVLTASLAVGSLSLGQAPSAAALSGSDWRAGNIMSDLVFFNNASMDANQIQYFLESRLPSCDTWGQKMYTSTLTRAQYGASKGVPAPYVCLKDYKENPTTHENNLKTAGNVVGGLTAAQIIKQAADTYKINPKVLIVLLQKEQSLVTDDWPWPIQYRSATGYGCPDTAPCDTEYYGFYNQVMNAAAAFRRYATYPESYRYKANQNNVILYNPNTSCGSSQVYIENQATAGLYVYTPYQPNQAALNNLYGIGDSCSAYGNRNFWRMFTDWFGSTQQEQKYLTFKSYLSDLGWTNTTVNEGITGTTGQSRPMEAFKINGEVEYATYSIGTGWQPTVDNGMITGTTSQNKPIKAFRIAPTGSIAEKFDLYYRAHVSSVGWMDWAKNGTIAGDLRANSNSIEAIQIRLIFKGQTGPSPNTAPALEDTTVAAPTAQKLAAQVTAHVSNVGWQPTVTDGMASGTTEESRRLEAIKVQLNNNTGTTGEILYSAHVEQIGWQDFVSNNKIAGTTGQAKRTEALRFMLTGGISTGYDVWYRAHIQGYGWLGWAKNGDPAGSTGQRLRMEAVEIRLLPKDAPPLASTNSFVNPNNIPLPDTYTLTYGTHLSSIGWVYGTKQNMTAGTTGQSRAMEAIKLQSLSSIAGDITLLCSAYVKDSGWTTPAPATTDCGTTGQSKPIYGIKLSLAGTASNNYDIVYRAHVSNIGWLGWVKNGSSAGATSLDKPIEALVLKLTHR